jgi:hypothetical protein
MPTFGFSAFLKLISLNSRPQRTEIRKRSNPGDGGYDFHRSLKLLAHRYIVDGIPFPELLLAAEDVTNEAERRSVKAGLQKLNEWRDLHPGTVLRFDPVLYESPAKNFKVQFLPNFGIRLGDQSVAVHLWNTGVPVLDERMTYAALSLVVSLYEDREARPDDVAVLSLPQSRLYRLSEVDLADYSEMGRRVVRRLDDLFEDVGRDPNSPTPTPRSPVPPAPK